ncbi:hypothetical protein [Agromyces lapidis]|uniref:Uncharacterized protein n=1 Tax=Agromyces lapidis TaxID=279574 RepID=A0ABV5SNZ7_9MICO|nr:hypothetical protein [Agromyces lapidis]
MYDLPRPDRPPAYQLNPLRVRRASLKVAFVLVTGGLLLAVIAGLSGAGLGGTITQVALEAGWWIMLARCLRSEEEELDPSRPWWQATYRPTASFAITAYFAFGIAFATINFMPLIEHLPMDDVLGFAIRQIVNILLGLFYLHSAVRLKIRELRRRADGAGR